MGVVPGTATDLCVVCVRVSRVLALLLVGEGAEYVLSLEGSVELKARFVVVVLEESDWVSLGFPEEVEVESMGFVATVITTTLVTVVVRDERDLKKKN